MKIAFLSIILSVLSLTLIFTRVSTQSTCSLKHLDFCFVRDLNTSLSLFTQLPESRAEYELWCARVNVLQKCFQKYAKKCFSNFQNEMVKWMSEPLQRGLHERCSTQVATYEPMMTSDAICLNRQPMRECFVTIRTAFMSEDNNEKGFLFCCSLMSVRKCLNGLDRKCSSKQTLEKFFALEDISNQFCAKNFEQNEEKCLKMTSNVKESEDKSAILRTFDAIFGNN